jgi:hypothetical protein
VHPTRTAAIFNDASLGELIGSHELDKDSFQVSSQLRTANFTTTNFILEN